MEASRNMAAPGAAGPAAQQQPQGQQQQQQQKNKMSDDIVGDVIAAAGLTQCRLIQREMLRSAIYPEQYSQEQHAILQGQFGECLQDYMMRYVPTLGTARTPEGRVYYVDNMTQKSRWDRPRILSEHIRMGKERQDYEEPWQRCEFRHINMLQCQYMESRNKIGQCQQEMVRMQNCLRRMLASRNEDEE